MVMVAFFIITKCWKQSSCPPRGEYVNSFRYIHTTEFFLLSNKEEHNADTLPGVRVSLLFARWLFLSLRWQLM